MAELVDALLQLKQRGLQSTAGQSQTFAVKVDIVAFFLLRFDFRHRLENEDIAVECNDREFKNVAGNGILQNIVIKFTDKALEQIPVGVHGSGCVDHDRGGTTFIGVHHVHRLFGGRDIIADVGVSQNILDRHKIKILRINDIF